MAFITFQPHDYFFTKLYTGNGSAGHSITGVGFQPDWVWMKPRAFSENHALYDSVRGTTKRLMSNTTEMEETRSNGLSAFGADGFTVNADNGENKNSETMVAWNWKGGTTSGITTNGSTTITPSTYSFNAAAGIAILKFTGNSTAGAKLAHGLGGCDAFFVKRIGTGGDDWRTYHASNGGTKNIKLNSSDQVATGTNIFNDANPDSVNITLGSHSSANASDTMICYAFKSIKGFSKFAKYKGNGNANGTFVYTGFKPAYIMVRFNGSGDGYNWIIYDNKRPNSSNPTPNILEADTADAKNTSSNFNCDILSNGFKFRGTESNVNDTNAEYIYYAFAEEPLVASNGTPATAR